LPCAENTLVFLRVFKYIPPYTKLEEAKMPEYTDSAPTTTLTLPPELDHRLDDLARQEGISKSALLLKAIEKYLEDLEDITDAEQALTEFHASGAKAVPLQEVMKRCGMEY
jgi:RHH-type rel operon transcriptional repressor/antitoxin RelB